MNRRAFGDLFAKFAVRFFLSPSLSLRALFTGSALVEEIRLQRCVPLFYFFVVFFFSLELVALLSRSFCLLAFYIVTRCSARRRRVVTFNFPVALVPNWAIYTIDFSVSRRPGLFSPPSELSVFPFYFFSSLSAGRRPHRVNRRDVFMSLCLAGREPRGGMELFSVCEIVEKLEII